MGTSREQLASVLRQSRIDAGYSSHGALARKLNVSRPVISKAENAAQPPPSDSVLAGWAAATGASLDTLMDLARRARAGVPDWFVSYWQAESEAAILRYWSPIIITPVFQTAAYARALLLGAQTDTSDEAIGALVQAKAERAAILDRTDPPDVVALIDEPVLYRLIGSSETMYEQLTRIAELAARPYVCVQVVPADVGATAGLSGAMNLASGDGTPVVLHTDAVPEGHTTESSSVVHRATVAFERIRGYALPRDQSRGMIMEAAEDRWKPR